MSLWHPKGSNYWSIFPFILQAEETQKCHFGPNATKLSLRAFMLKNSAPLICQDMLTLPVFISSFFSLCLSHSFLMTTSNRIGMTECDELQRQGPRLRSCLPKVYLLTKPCTRRELCIFAGEFGICSGHQVCQEDKIIVTAPCPLNWASPVSSKIAVLWTGALQTFISLILRGTEQHSHLLSISGARVAQEFTLLC